MKIRLENVSKEYNLGKTKVRALDNVNFQVDEQEFITIAGPSGSGKTTLLNVLGCLDTPSEGSVYFDDKKISDLSLAKKADLRNEKIGFIFQSFNLIPVLSVYENIELPTLIGHKKTKSKETRDWIMHLISAVGLENRVKHRPDELSGGQRQRVAIARALVNKPACILADEPTANLDSDTSFMILELLQQLNRDEKTSFVFCTHDVDIISQCSSVVRIKDGQIVSDPRTQQSNGQPSVKEGVIIADATV
ncbi:ABC transporter ATP-binding protein [Aliikangiella maris]|uniref:ABC transporter ATP-binding protein n=2 Tax=Aliikangiella maris TaxID=3162458 RepID=A0ABV3MLV2_9GAMM